MKTKSKNIHSLEMNKIKMEKTSSKRRSEIARLAAQARWRRKELSKTGERVDYFPPEKKDRYQGIHIEKHTEVYIKRVKVK